MSIEQEKLDMKHKLANFISNKRKTLCVLYVGKKYNVSKWEDSKYIKVKVKLGLKTLILNIINDHSTEVIEEYMQRFSKSSSSHRFIMALSDRKIKGVNAPKSVIVTPEMEFTKKFDAHFGNSTHKLIRELLKFYSNLSRNDRFSDKNVVNMLDGERVDLRDKDVQLRIYKKIYEEFNDPFVLRLALTPQYHFRYQGVNFNGFFELLRSIYTRIYSPKPRGQQYGIVDRATYKQLVERLNNIKGDVNKMMHFMKLSAAYSIWLSKSKGIELIVDKSQFLIDDKFNLGVCFLEQRRMFDPFPIEDLKEMLSCGYFYNPWEYLHNILLGSSPKSINYLGNFRKFKYQLQLERLDAKSEKERVQSVSPVKEGVSSIQAVAIR